MHTGIAGEVRCVVRKADGTTKADTGYQKNLILNQGLDFFGGNKGSSIFARCVIGSGNSTPAVTQTSLDIFIKSTTSTGASSSQHNYDGSALYKTSKTHKYSFTGLNNVNITEVGLASKGTTELDTYLCTRALIKDSLGAPTAISVKTGETLDIYYRVWQVFNTADIDGLINMLDGVGGSKPYKTKARLYNIGLVAHTQELGTPVDFATPFFALVGYPNGQELAPLRGELSGNIGAGGNTAANDPYVTGSYRRRGNFYVPLGVFNGDLRIITIGNSLGRWQIRYGSVADDSPIPKTSKDTLTLAYEASWGRYEGVLE